MKDIDPAITPFEPGAPAPAGFIPLSVPEIHGNEWKYIKECLDTNWVSSVGSFVDRFEDMVAGYVGAKYAVATASGTAALHVALLTAGVGPDDEALVSTLTFIAPANAIRYVGAWPVFMDAEPDYWQMDPQKVADFLDKGCRWHQGALYNRTTRRRVKAILPVHVLGHPCDMEPILQAAGKYDLTVIEDASESLGARYNGGMVGNLGDIGCFSFNGNKTMTSGGGGMIVTDNEAWARRAKHLTTQAKDDPVEYIHNEIGYNYRLTNIQAALGCAQMEQFPEFVSAKRETARAYTESLDEIPGISGMREAPWAWSVSWLYTVLVDQARFGIDSRSLMARLGKSGIQARPLWQPLHLSPAHRGSAASDCAVAKELARNALSLPSSVGLTSSERTRVINAVRESGPDAPAGPGERFGE